MTFRPILRGLLATIAAYFGALVVVVIAMSSYATGDPNIDGKDTNLSLLNLVAKLGLAFVTGFVSGYCSRKLGWLVGALTVLAILLIAALLPASFFVFAFFKGDDLLFGVVYVLVGAISGALGGLLAARRKMGDQHKA